MEEAFQALMNYDWGGDRIALSPITERVAAVHEKPEERAELEARLVGVLGGNAPLPAKEFVCRQLSVMGTKQSVLALSAMLVDAQTNDMARMALELIPDEAAGAAMLARLPELDGLRRIGVISSLGQRRDARAAAAIGTFLTNADEATVIAAAQALGQIAGSEAVAALGAVAESSTGAVRLAVLDAGLKCGDHCIDEGNLEAARTIYTWVAEHADTPAAAAAAARVGLARVEAKGAAS